MVATPPPSESPKSYAEFFSSAAKYLKDHPNLLFALALAIVLLAAGAQALENLRLILIGVIILAVLGTSGWIFIQVRSGQAAVVQPAPAQSTHTWTDSIAASGDIEVDSSTNVEHSIAETGYVQSTAGGARSFKSGGIRIGNDAHVVNSEFRTGDVGSEPPNRTRPESESGEE